MTTTASRPVLGAHISGFSAFVIAAVLDDALATRVVRLQEQVAVGRLDPERMVELRQTWAAIRAAGQEWTRWRAALDGNAEDLAAEMPGGSIRESEIDTALAAQVLGVTPRRIRQLVAAGHLPARRAGRTWLVDRCAVELRKGM